MKKLTGVISNTFAEVQNYSEGPKRIPAHTY